MVELAHEALLNNWSLFKEWIEQDREALRTRRRLDEAVAEWIGNNRDSSFLYRGARLAQAEEWKDRHPGELNQDARAFLATSVAAALAGGGSIDDAAELAAAEAEPQADLNASVEYRTHLVKVLTRRALTEASA